jgi:hypothetical protein
MCYEHVTFVFRKYGRGRCLGNDWGADSYKEGDRAEARRLPAAVAFRQWGERYDAHNDVDEGGPQAGV